MERTENRYSFGIMRECVYVCVYGGSEVLQVWDHSTGLDTYTVTYTVCVDSIRLQLLSG